MHKQVEKLDRHFHKFLALRSQGINDWSLRPYGHRSKMLTKHPLPHVSGACAACRSTRPGVGGARTKSQREWPIRVLNQGIGSPGVGDVSTPSKSKRARRRTQKEVHSAVRTRLSSVRRTAALKTPVVLNSRVFPNPQRPTLATVARDCRTLRATYWYSYHS